MANNLGSKAEYDIDEILPRKQNDFGTKRFLFVSRLSPKKKLDLAIECFNAFKGRDYVFNIVGGREDDDHFDQLMELSKDNPQIKFLGAKRPDELKDIYTDAHFFILPTMHENYGHVIVEALSYGCPVLISRNTPWHGLESNNIGWDLPLDQSSFSEKIEVCLDMDFEEYSSKSKSAFTFAKGHIEDDSSLEAYKKNFA